MNTYQILDCGDFIGYITTDDIFKSKSLTRLIKAQFTSSGYTNHIVKMEDENEGCIILHHGDGDNYVFDIESWSVRNLISPVS